MAKKMWGGRFAKKTNPLVDEFTRSIQYDQRLADTDIIGSILHVQILKNSGYLLSSEADKLIKGLYSIHQKIEKGILKPGTEVEDVHTFIQNKLADEAGDSALKLQTCRSRNEQVVFATKLYCKIAVTDICIAIEDLEAGFCDLADRNSHIIIPGFTHMQHAQPVYLRDYLLSYVRMLERDEKRLGYIFENMELTQGAGALAGTPIDASQYTLKKSKILKESQKIIDAFSIKPSVNSLDSVSDRDFVIEIISALSIIAMHLSRLSEDLIIWATKEFDFIEIDDAFSTGSSLMPQKKNPDVLELIRGYSGRLYGNLVSVLTMMKGLPLAYNRDMQLDKEPLFNSFDVVSLELRVLSGLIKTLKFNEQKIKEYLNDESLYATDMVYYLVDKKIPFKHAHDIVGKLVKYSIDNALPIKEMSEDLLSEFSDKLLKQEIIKLFDPLVSVKAKKSIKR